MTPDSTQWRNASKYAFIDQVAAEAVAWEFLRRNTKYQRDFAEHGNESDPAIISQLRERWGLRFHG
ncbi:transcriptional regulator domain-containing protein [Oryzicola mucosus]|uniref:transcriptional regulator domain-containing protein n=1 Tax=Oryzicola mucosus TaxID=2767425 RepID=UPI001E315DDA|nr:DUF6499 domain-containing protein [Oryzicola mucosus]